DGARFASIAVLEPLSGMPVVSRIGVATDEEGDLIFLASEISNHTRALSSDPRASIMVGEPGKGDPLAHPRITLIGEIEIVDREGGNQASLRERYLQHHPKARLYVDFLDFHFFRMNLQRANLNGGFGKAFELEPKDFAISKS
ncbi:MAG: HugZ family protein, partial [Hyphomicrobiales bacterium]|nr:HugZ family protein [Hyphomicrobiales bacterium]